MPRGGSLRHLNSGLTVAKPEQIVMKVVDLKEANAEVYYRAFRSFDSATRRKLALRILRDQALIQDVYDPKLKYSFIRQLYFEGWTLTKIAKQFGITKASASRIVRHKQELVSEGQRKRKQGKGT